jgi:chromosome segregation ATPase
MHNLEVQWETHRKPLDEEKENLKQLLMNKKQQMQQKMEETKTLRQEIDDLNADLTSKENLIKELNKEMESMPKDQTKTSNRQFFTKRILEIVANIDKQKKEIDKVSINFYF